MCEVQFDFYFENKFPQFDSINTSQTYKSATQQKLYEYSIVRLIKIFSLKG